MFFDMKYSSDLMCSIHSLEEMQGLKTEEGRIRFLFLREILALFEFIEENASSISQALRQSDP